VRHSICVCVCMSVCKRERDTVCISAGAGGGDYGDRNNSFVNVALAHYIYTSYAGENTCMC